VLRSAAVSGKVDELAENGTPTIDYGAADAPNLSAHGVPQHPSSRMEYDRPTSRSEHKCSRLENRSETSSALKLQISPTSIVHFICFFNYIHTQSTSKEFRFDFR
jgi:hypothetical protein